MSELLKWKNKKGRKPLLLEGVRQVGKTYLLAELIDLFNGSMKQELVFVFH